MDRCESTGSGRQHACCRTASEVARTGSRPCPASLWVRRSTPPCSTTPRCTVGHDTPCAAATSDWSRPSSTATASAARSLVVVRIPAGTCATCSVNDCRAQSRVRHRQRRLRHCTATCPPPHGRSCGRVSTQSFPDVDSVGHAGQRAAPGGRRWPTARSSPRTARARHAPPATRPGPTDTTHHRYGQPRSAALLSLLQNTARIKESRAAHVLARRTGQSLRLPARSKSHQHCDTNRGKPGRPTQAPCRHPRYRAAHRHRRAPPRVRIDLSRVEFLSVSAARALTVDTDVYRERGGRSNGAPPNPHLGKVLRMLRRGSRDQISSSVNGEHRNPCVGRQTAARR
jgi:hypothetical protein